MLEKLKQNKLDIAGRVLYAVLGALVLFMIRPAPDYNGNTIILKVTETITLKETKEVEKKSDKTEKKDQVIIRVIERPNEKITETITDKGVIAEKTEEKSKEIREEKIERKLEKEIKLASAHKPFAFGVVASPITKKDFDVIATITPFEKLPLSFVATNPVNKIEPKIGIMIKW
jgi:hypothetical protein